METVTFSTIEYASGEILLEYLKRAAKINKKDDSLGASLSTHQNSIAVALGYQNWSMLHKNIDGLTCIQLGGVINRVLRHKTLGPMIDYMAERTIDVEDATQEMSDWARQKYTPLIEFAYYDSESPTGYSWPEVDMALELSEEFGGKFPDELITQVGNDLDVSEGPWGLEDFGDD